MLGRRRMARVRGGFRPMSAAYNALYGHMYHVIVCRPYPGSQQSYVAYGKERLCQTNDDVIPCSRSGVPRPLKETHACSTTHTHSTHVLQLAYKATQRNQLKSLGTSPDSQPVFVQN